MNLLIASDHAGYELKEALKARAASIGVEWTDLGTHSAASVDYPDYGDALAKKLVETGAETHLGVLICGSGVGISIAANRHPEIRAVLAESPEVARLGREHNHANVLCFGSRIVSEERAIELIRAFIDAKPDPGERHLRRVQKLSAQRIKGGSP
ncbi:RpiB/LacA/LacB family sugar-phosphate isomerase [bacterium]|jgi:ribose 5-phosphate isomerase B|nr:RpiB/LacA/LacB family sugar-phosphate isomerase [bacterium]